MSSETVCYIKSIVLGLSNVSGNEQDIHWFQYSVWALSSAQGITVLLALPSVGRGGSWCQSRAIFSGWGCHWNDAAPPTIFRGSPNSVSRSLQVDITFSALINALYSPCSSWMIHRPPTTWLYWSISSATTPTSWCSLFQTSQLWFAESKSSDTWTSLYEEASVYFHSLWMSHWSGPQMQGKCNLQCWGPELWGWSKPKLSFIFSRTLKVRLQKCLGTSVSTPVTSTGSCRLDGALFLLLWHPTSRGMRTCIQCLYELSSPPL